MISAPDAHCESTSSSRGIEEAKACMFVLLCNSGLRKNHVLYLEKYCALSLSLWNSSYIELRRESETGRNTALFDAMYTVALQGRNRAAMSMSNAVMAQPP
jgi:hypothetical protein